MKGRMLRKLKTMSSLVFQADESFSEMSSAHSCAETNAKTESFSNSMNPAAAKSQEEAISISEYEEKCPPAGKECVVLYSTSLRGIRKTFEDCNAIRFLLGSFRVVYSERDVSMHLQYREELWRVLGDRVVPPRLFIRGRYIGGAEEVVGLHEKGLLKPLLQGIPLSPTTSPCSGCAGMRFVLCCRCHGGRRVVAEGSGLGRIRCPDCNENGLIKCSICS